MAKTHKLKILPQFFKEARSGNKYFEIRKNDRDYQVDDYIVLNEYNGKNYTGKKIAGKITFITDFEQKDGYVVFGWMPVGLMESTLENEILKAIKADLYTKNKLVAKGGSHK
ncbi:DUF3850 domain-containing protein [Listeria valentina]|uniref:DUF3850 domain-containing protein n=1 Tax=Listeria valentina TaxID=2705293 RepID=UPI0014303055